jgi:hypothetical protein
MNWSLALTSNVLGALLLVLCVPAMLVPRPAQRLLLAFSRNEWAGWILTAISMVWVALLLLDMSFHRFEPYKPAIYFVAPVAFLLMVFYMDELLAPRALGGLLLLVAHPILEITRWHESSLRLVVTSLVYVGVVVGIILMLSPYRFRYFAEYWAKDSSRCRVGGTLGVIVGGLLVLLGLTVY